jgi:hypothetical protein
MGGFAGQARLLGKVLALHTRVVQLGVGVADLLAADEELEPLGHADERAVRLGERRHDLGVLGDEGRVQALRLEELAHELVEQARRRARRGALDALGDAERVERRARGVAREVLGQLDAERRLEVIRRRDAH